MKEVDLLIITALPKELNAVLNLKEGGREVWEQEQTPEKHIYYLTDLPLSNGASFKIAALAQWQMGPTAAAIVVSSILNLIKTKMISLVGICAGWRQKNVGLGDVIVASQAFFYDVGKMKEGRLSPEMQSYQVHPHIQQWLQDFIESNRSWIATIKTPRPLSFRYQKEYLLYKIAESQNYDWIRAEETTKNCPDWSEVIPYLEKKGLITKKLTLTPEGEEYLSDLKIRKRQFAPEPDSPEPKAHYGSFASGNSVIEDRFIFDELAERDRKILALEMEAASFLRACYAKDSSLVAFVVKGVCDYADSEKADNFHRYSAEAAARFMVAFAAEALPRIRSQQDKTDPSTAKPTETDESETIKILFLAANPSDTDPLKLDEEVRLIDEKLRLSKYRDRFDIKQHWAVRVGDIQSLLLRHQPHIVHFSGHGSKAGEIILKDGLGNSGYVPVEALKNLFSILKDNIRCVVLNACYSEEQARAIAQHIDCVVGMSKSILDTSAINFAASFYQGLGYGRTIKESFDLGCNQIGLSGIDASGSKTRQFDLDSEQTGQDRLKEQDRPKLLALDERSKNIRFVSQNGGTRKPSARSTEETNKESPYQGKYIINIQSANNVHIGDRISEPITIESKEIKSSEKVLFSW
ncbi:MAG: CHAT domain-containing protein, partial [Blastocatellia bacterium]|nr:CHAT domain-containing protein [Blastocatellia bacterium]